MTLALVGDPTAVDWSAMSQHTTGVIPRRSVVQLMTVHSGFYVTIVRLM